MEYFYFAKKDWPEGETKPRRVFLVEKEMNDPNPEKLVDPQTKKKVVVFRYYDSPPALNFSDPNRGGYAGKYGKFMNKRKEAMAKRESSGKTIPEMAKELGLCYEHERFNPYTEKTEKVTKYVTSDTPGSVEWEKLPLEKRKIAEQYGFIPQKEFESPAMGFERVKKTEEIALEENNIEKEMEVIYIGKINTKQEGKKKNGKK